ncbi:MAG: lipoprotein [Woeseiaceae bacterium]|nr:lipoprotein [Woeseiaceae bacterium]
MLLLPFFFWLTVAGCGQKGPLFLPGDPSVMQTTIPELPEQDGMTEPADSEPGEEDSGEEPEDDSP